MLRKLSTVSGCCAHKAIIAVFSLLVLLVFAAPSRADIVFQNQTTGQLVNWMMDSITLVKYSLPPSPGTPNWKVVGSGDFSGDGKPDLLFQNQQTGDLIFWEMNGSTFINWYYINPTVPGPIDWKVVTVGDIDGDGKPDIVFQNQSTGQLVYWLMNGAALRSLGFLPDPGSPTWKVVASADFNHDDNVDLLFQNQQSGKLVYWLLNRAALITFGYLPDPGSPVWRAAGIDDFNSDGNPDLLFQNQQTGKLVYWLLDGVGITNIGSIIPNNPGSPDWKVAAIWAAQTGSASGIIQ